MKIYLIVAKNGDIKILLRGKDGAVEFAEDNHLAERVFEVEAEEVWRKEK